MPRSTCHCNVDSVCLCVAWCNVSLRVQGYLVQICDILFKKDIIEMKMEQKEALYKKYYEFDGKSDYIFFIYSNKQFYIIKNKNN